MDKNLCLIQIVERIKARIFFSSQEIPDYEPVDINNVIPLFVFLIIGGTVVSCVIACAEMIIHNVNNFFSRRYNTKEYGYLMCSSCKMERVYFFIQKLTALVES